MSILNAIYQKSSAQACLHGRYNLGYILGTGGLGVVYLAHDQVTQQSVVVKKLKTKFYDYPECIATFLQEAQLEINLSHPHILSALHMITEKPYCKIMPYHPAISLKKYLALTPKLSKKQIQTFIEQLSSALAYLHSLAIIHGDLKPSNILIDSTQQLQLTDFGSAMPLQRSIACAHQAISLPYASPNRLQGKPPVFNDDLYALNQIYKELCLKC